MSANIMRFSCYFDEITLRSKQGWLHVIDSRRCDLYIMY